MVKRQHQFDFLGGGVGWGGLQDLRCSALGLEKTESIRPKRVLRLIRTSHNSARKVPIVPTCLPYKTRHVNRVKDWFIPNKKNLWTFFVFGSCFRTLAVNLFLFFFFPFFFPLFFFFFIPNEPVKIGHPTDDAGFQLQSKEAGCIRLNSGSRLKSLL